MCIHFWLSSIYIYIYVYYSNEISVYMTPFNKDKNIDSSPCSLLNFLRYIELILQLGTHVCFNWHICTTLVMKYFKWLCHLLQPLSNWSWLAGAVFWKVCDDWLYWRVPHDWEEATQIFMLECIVFFMIMYAMRDQDLN